MLFRRPCWLWGGGAWAYFASGDGLSEADRNLPEQYRSAAIKEQAQEPSKMFDTFRSLRDDDSLTDEQRQQARRNMRNAMREQMMARVDEYFEASEDDKNEILDDHIDWFQSRRAEMQAARRDAEKKGEGMPERGPRPQRTQEERKAANESRNPDESAKMTAYFTAMRKRAMERGIQMGGPGGRGGRGGGRRGP